MTTTYNAKKIIVGALLSGGITLAGLGLSVGTAQAFNPQPEPPGRPVIDNAYTPHHPNTAATTTGPTHCVNWHCGPDDVA
ncbi:hypothetical protein FZI85_07780 [Mycobacterium sp. CBMA293]|uniref:hypothetical protein n=1 Tax=unclassified Mycolicibacterium TaxID=2636767 RepID=UPI0012DD9E04|nr:MULTISPECIES: hypothetical protein [unclassified Mycolicibacterium]MUL46500.1 hypothetical protein [Mycolicibacterium sp. CBMA 360]MUL56988.1 hypothetical protein [Mycolicibacterium sp. CBMA 335]MUL70028.1 hypothetical protein [Mycolicibacterium sp. CBMA 311]MUL92076.1 hypothetical protein [Mycolicibacterium sp. CBMA 230]MUM05813.1 hypothetical protein [Mycolicibacterium sp. CBMA 213]